MLGNLEEGKMISGLRILAKTLLPSSVASGLVMPAFSPVVFFFFPHQPRETIGSSEAFTLFLFV